MSKSDDTFLGFVELNERAWGTESYVGRPKLQEILDARVVVFWHSTKRRDPGLRISVYPDLKALHHYTSRMLIHSNTQQPDRRIARVYVDRRRMRLKGIKLVFDLED